MKIRHELENKKLRNENRNCPLNYFYSVRNLPNYKYHYLDSRVIEFSIGQFLVFLIYFIIKLKENKELCCKLTSHYTKPSNFEVEWEMDREKIAILGKEIGGGEFGKVFKGKLKLCKSYDVAIKMIKNNNERKKELFINECNLMKKLKHDKIIKLYCICSKEEPVWMVLEYLPKGSLKKYLKENMTKLALKDVIDIITQIASGMKYLELIEVVHRDLSARNILVGNDNLIKIADFGLGVKLLRGKVENNSDRLPIKWMVRLITF